VNILVFMKDVSCPNHDKVKRYRQKNAADKDHGGTENNVAELHIAGGHSLYRQGKYKKRIIHGVFAIKDEPGVPHKTRVVMELPRKRLG